jgi:hypothetical protein
MTNMHGRDRYRRRFEEGRSRLMAKKLTLLGAAIAVLGLAVTMVVPALADDGHEKLSFTVTDKASDDDKTISLIDAGEAGFSVGDYLVFEREPVFNKSQTTRVGYFTGYAMVVAIDPQTFVSTLESDQTLTLRDGTITSEGTDVFQDEVNGVGNFAVTGGTGRYKTAQGEMHATFNEQEGTFKFELFL